MATTYDHINASKRNSVLLIAAFSLLIAGVGWVFAGPLGYGYGMLAFAVAIAFVMNLVGYFQGDQIALRVSGAEGPTEKERSPYVWRMVENLCITAGMPMPKIYLIPDKTMNAFATGRDPAHASIALTTGIVEGLENEQLEGVIAHELSHVKNYDVRYMTLVVVLVGTIALLSNLFFRMSFLGRGSNRQGGAIFAIIGIVLVIFSPVIAQLIKFAVSRRREFLADASGALLTRYPEGLAQALEHIGAQGQPLARANQATAHLFLANPFGARSGGMSKLFATHPPIKERVQRLREMGGGR
jgi:heat shock protein HtpX